MIFALANDLDLDRVKLYSKYENRKNNFKQKIQYLDARIAEKMIRNYVNSAKITLTQTFSQQKFLKNNFNIDSTVVRNSFPYTILNNVSKENVIIWVSNIRFQKRPEILCKLADDIKLPGWKIYMIGFYEGYEQLIENVKNPDFKALGKLPFEDAMEWFKKSKILINTSSHEGFPNTFIQAWFTKTLVISYSFDPDKLLKEKQMGFLADGDYEKFKKLILDYTGEKKYDHILENSYNFANEEFKLENNIDKLESILLA